MKQDFLNAIQLESLDSLNSVLAKFKKAKEIKSNGKVEIGFIVKTLKPLGLALGTALAPKNFAVVWLKQLARDDKAAVRCLACIVLGEVGKVNPESIMALAHKLAADDRWEVRECLANTFDDQISPAQPQFVFNLMSQWVTDPSPNVRRCTTNALLRYGIQQPRNVIRLMENLRHDEQEYVQKNVVFCLQQIAKINHSILGKGNPDNPDVMLETLRTWSKDTHAGNRWIVANTLGNAWAKNRIPEALALLEILAADENKTVRGAVAAALRDLAKYDAEAATAAAQRWAQDPRGTVQQTGVLALKKIARLTHAD